VARKNTLKAFKMLDAGDVSGNLQSATTNVLNLDKASISVTWTGSSPVGTLEVLARNGEDDAWSALNFGSAISISGNSGDHRILLNEMPFTDIRIDYTATSGTGSLTAIITAKQVGG
jgi:hypothetical protein